MPAFESFASESFWKGYYDLPVDVQKLADKAYKLFKKNPHHPSLRFKKVGKKQPVYSARVTDFYRVLCYLDGHNAYWFWIGDHRAYDKLIKDM
jgi:mRNA-degrading endonuclease RelE of RelBE toxin-antitoxin system